MAAPRRSRDRVARSSRLTDKGVRCYSGRAMETAEVRKQVNELWKQAVDQLEAVKEVLQGRLEEDLVRLRTERDKLLKTLGEQTYRLANQGKLPVPTVVKRTVERLNSVIDGIVNAQRGARKTKKTGKKTAPRKSSKKKARAGA
jgi:hypothetical protein